MAQVVVIQHNYLGFSRSKCLGRAEGTELNVMKLKTRHKAKSSTALICKKCGDGVKESVCQAEQEMR